MIQEILSLEKDARLEYLKKNKSLIFKEKKLQMKKADGIGMTVKQNAVKKEASDKLSIKAVINTTNVLDSHMDLHVPGIWNKSLADKDTHLLLQEHEMKFDHVISENAKAYVQSFSFRELGYDMPGTTQALMFDAQPDMSDNPFMYKKYAEGKVKQHSVGMMYVNGFLAINTEEKGYEEEKEIWDKYYPEIANPEMADEYGFFFVVTEAKVIEGSAVLLGSNSITPTYSTSLPSSDTKNDSRENTIKEIKGIFKSLNN